MIYFNFYHFYNKKAILININQFNLEFHSTNLKPVNKLPEFPTELSE